MSTKRKPIDANQPIPNLNEPWDNGTEAYTGKHIEDFLKTVLRTKAGCFYYDTTNNRYLVFSDEEARDAYLDDTTQIDLIIGSFDAPSEYSATINLFSDTNKTILLGDKGNVLRFSFETVNRAGQVQAEDVNCTFTFNRSGSKQVVNKRYTFGTLVEFPIDEYLQTAGTTSITIAIAGINTLAATTAAITYRVINLALKDNTDISRTYTNEEELYIPYSISGTGTKIMEWFIDGQRLEYVKTEDEIISAKEDRTKRISLSGLTPGAHSLQFRAYTELEGDIFYSNLFYRTVIVKSGLVSQDIAIAVAYEMPPNSPLVQPGDSLVLYGLTQYVPYTLRFATYIPYGATLPAEIKLDDDVVSTLNATNNTEYNVDFVPSSSGDSTISISIEETTVELSATISQSTINISEDTTNLVLWLNAMGKSNSSADRDSWTFGNYSATFENVSWSDISGWTNDGLALKADSAVEVNCKPFALNPSAAVSGLTVEFEFGTRNVTNEDRVICNLTNSSGVGLVLTASGATLTSSSNKTTSVKFKSEETQRIAIVISPKTTNTLAYIYVDGVMSGVVNYEPTDDYINNANIRFEGYDDAEVVIKNMRVYSRALRPDQILNNYILYRPTATEMIRVYNKNNIYEEGTDNIVPDNLVGQLPVMIITGNVDELLGMENTDKNKAVTVNVEFTNLQNIDRSFKMTGARLRGQGTSSMFYPIKNFRIDTTPQACTLYDSNNNRVQDKKYALRSNSIPVNCWCLKADFAESSSSHNTGTARLWNNVMKNTIINGEYALRTEAQQAAIDNGYELDVRTTIDGYPIALFYRVTETSPLVFLGKYNFNNDKSTEAVFGFKDIPGFDNTNVECWEVLNSEDDRVLFKSVDNWDSAWADSFEARYPDKNKNTLRLKRLATWIASTKSNFSKFEAEMEDYLDLPKVAAYYVYLMRFGAVDQTVKNAMLTTEDGLHWFFINYDNDTILGVKNDGRLVFGPTIDRQSKDPVNPSDYAYAGHGSVLWNNLEASSTFMELVRQVDQAMFTAGLSYNGVLNEYENEQSAKWCERIYNADAQSKYIGPYINTGTNFLYSAQGSRKSHRRWWLSRRFSLMDAKFLSGDYRGKSLIINVLNMPEGKSFDLTAGYDLYYGYGINSGTLEAGVKLDAGETHTFTTPQTIGIGSPISIYAAANIGELDLHEFLPYFNTIQLQNVSDATLGTKLKKLVVGVDVSQNSARNENEAFTRISALGSATALEYLDICGATKINTLEGIENLKKLRKFYAKDTAITAFEAASGAPIEEIELPQTVTNLTLKEHKLLTLDHIGVANSGRNIKHIYVSGCSQLNGYSTLLQWFADKNAPSSECSVYIDGIDWSGIVATDLINMKEQLGSMTLKGKIMLSAAPEPEMVQRLKQLFGDSCFNFQSELFITSADAIFIIGPDAIVEGATEENAAIVTTTIISSNLDLSSVNVTVSGTNANTFATVLQDEETLKVYGAPIIKIWSSEIDETRNVNISILHTSTMGAMQWANKTIAIEKKRYPTGVTIQGESYAFKDRPYQCSVEVEGADTATGDWHLEWSVNNHATITSQSNEGCAFAIGEAAAIGSFITVHCDVVSVKKGTLASCDLEVKVMAPPFVILQDTNQYDTVTYNPAVLAVCKAQGWCEGNSMTNIEAMNVTDEMLREVFKGNTEITEFSQFAYFTGITALRKTFLNCTNLVNILLPNTITEIGQSAFGGTRIATIELPDSVTSVGDNAFYYCLNLSSIVLSNSLETIGNNAFDACRTLTTIEIPDSVVSIGNGAFNRCDGLTNIEIPISVTSLGQGVFASCSALTSVTLPNSINVIEDSMFYECHLLTSITIPDSVTSINQNAFANCQSLTSVTIPDSVTSIGQYAFSNCRSLTSITIPDSVTSIAYRAFLGCYTLASVEIPNSVVDLGIEVFNGCSALTTVTLGTGLTTLENSVFSNAPSILNLYAKRTEAPTVQTNSFTWGTASDSTDTNLYIHANATGYDSGNWPSLMKTESQHGFIIRYFTPKLDGYDRTYIAPGNNTLSATFIGEDTAIEDWTLEWSIAAPSAGTSSLESVTLASQNNHSCSLRVASDFVEGNISVTCTMKNSQGTVVGTITQDIQVSNPPFVIMQNTDPTDTETYNPEVLAVCYAQGWCASENEMTNLEAQGVTDSQLNNVFMYNTTITHFEQFRYFTGLENLLDNAFNGCSYLNTIVLPETITSIGSSAFQSCGLTGHLVIPDLVTYLASNAFRNCTIAEITIGAGVLTISKDAFNSCTNLQTVNYNAVACTSANGNSGGIFSGCSALQTLNIGEGVRSIPKMAFNNCVWSVLNFNAIECTNSGSDQSYAAFKNASVDTINWGPYVKRLPNLLFCNNLQYSADSFDIPDSVETIGSGFFSDNTSIVTITGGASVVTVETYAFLRCTALSSFPFDGIVNIGEGAFSGCSLHACLELPETLRTLGAGAFAGCKSLESVTIPLYVTDIGTRLLRNCTSLTTLNYNAIHSSCSGSEGICVNCNNLTTLNIGNQVTTIPMYLFSNTPSFTTLHLPDSVTSIGYGAFSNCTALESIRLSNSITLLISNQFDRCTSLNTLVVPDGITRIGGFSGCTSLSSITLPPSLIKVEDYSFNQCPLTTIYSYPMNSPTIGNKFNANNPESSITVYVRPGATGYNKSPWTNSKYTLSYTLSDPE